MTPREYIERLGALVAAGKDREALAFAHTEGPEVQPSLSAEEFSHIDGLLESAAMAVSLEDAATR